MRRHDRLRSGAGAGALLLVAALAVPSVATARPADVNVVNVPTVKLDADANTVKLDANANTVRIDASANAVTQAPNRQFTTQIDMATVTGSASACTFSSFDLPVGEIIALDSVYADFGGSKIADAPRASLRFHRKTGDAASTIFDIGVPVTVPNAFGNATGVLPLDGMVVRRASLAAAQVGDIFIVEMCANRGTAASSTADFLLIGHRGG